jgi:hypothetical protein
VSLGEDHWLRAGVPRDVGATVLAYDSTATRSRRDPTGGAVRRGRQRRHRALTALVAALGLALFSVPAGAVPGTARPTAMPLPPGSPGRPLVDVGALTCASLGACTAVGSYLVSSGQFRPVGYVLEGGWHARGVSVPDPSSPTTTLLDVACPEPHRCEAVGGTSATDGTSQPIVTTLVNGVWATPTTSVPVPAGAATSTLRSVWCAAVGRCLAIGTYATGLAARSRLFEDRLANGTWTGPVVLPTPTSPNVHGPITDTSLSCATSATCVLVGTLISRNTAATIGWSELERGGTWHAAAFLLPAGTNRSTLLAVSCRGTSCLAVGAAGPTSPDLTDAPFAVELSGTRWLHFALLPWRFAAPVTTGGALSGVSCTSARHCVAVGTLTDGPPLRTAPSVRVPVAYTYASGRWSAPAIPEPPASRGSASVAATLDRISCASSAACVAVGTTTPRAHNKAGRFPYAVEVTPIGVGSAPGAATALRLTPAGATLHASWTAPTRLGGAPILSFLVVARSPGEPTVACVAVTTSCALGGIDAGHRYTVDVTAINASRHSGPTLRRVVVA